MHIHIRNIKLHCWLALFWMFFGLKIVCELFVRYAFLQYISLDVQTYLRYLGEISFWLIGCHS